MEVCKEEVLGNLTEDVKNVLEELCQSGFDTVHDSTLEALRDMTGLTKQYGMAYLSELLEELEKGLSMRRHRMERTEDALAKIYAQLNEYLYMCGEKAAYDMGWNTYVKEWEEETGTDRKGAWL